MRAAFWNLKDVGLAVVLFIPSVITGALIARLIPAPQVAVQQMIAQLIAYALWFAALGFLFNLSYGVPLFEALGWHNNGRIGTCLWIGAALAFLVAYAGTALDAPHVDPPYKALLSDKRSLILFALGGVIIGPIAEELIFRGFLMPLLLKWMPGAAAAFAVALPFALLHGPAYQWSWQHIVLLFLAGSAFGLARWKFDSTLSSSVMHSAYNFTFLAGLIANG
jgi:membrane protease YdiL (CAAX protease family)